MIRVEQNCRGSERKSKNKERERKKENAYCPKNGGAFSWLENRNHT
jgi:hypothetical protein